MYKFIVIDKFDQWDEIIKKFNNIDIYYSYEYGNSSAKIEGGQLFAAYFESDTTRIFYPFIKRKIPKQVFECECFDVVTPYGYGGPLINGDPKSIKEFYTLFGEYCKLNNIITETIRLHPLHKNEILLQEIMDIQYIRKTTAVDLTVSLEEIRNNYTQMNKRNIKRARMNSLSCFIAENSKENIDLFVNLYTETMNRNSAGSFYYFDNRYFSELVKETSISSTFLLFAKFNNEVVAGVMVIIGNEYAHYHLGASKTKYLELRPNNILFDFMIEFCKCKGVKSLHLGGGYQENDGLFKFKSSFTNHNNYSYYIGKKVYNLNQYKEIVDHTMNYYEISENFFPIYRGIKRKKILKPKNTGRCSVLEY